MKHEGSQTPPDKFTNLRRQAEELLQAQLQTDSPKTAGVYELFEELLPAEAHRLLYELQVHQIELEIQNEELHRTQLKLERSLQNYFDLYDLAPVGYFTLSEHSLILQANLTGAVMLGVERHRLVKQPFTRFVTRADQDVYYLHHRELFRSSAPQVCEISLVKKDGAQFYARMDSAIAQESESSTAVSRVVVSDITEQVQAKETLQQRSRELELLNRTGHAFSSTLELDQVLTTFLEETCHLLAVTACSIWLVETATGNLVCRQTTGPPGEIASNWRPAADEQLLNWVRRHWPSLKVADIRAGQNYVSDINEPTRPDSHSVLIVPLEVNGDVIGVIQLVDKKANRFDDADLRLIESLAATAAIAIENARLYHTTKELHRQAARDAETKATLLNEVNHRVRNNLAAIMGLLYLEKHHTEDQTDETFQNILVDLIGRVKGLATVHNLLAASTWAPLPLSELAEEIIHSSIQALRLDNRASINVLPSPIRVRPNQAHSLALIINELATNSGKYAWPEQEMGQITVHLKLEDDTVEFQYRDNGAGYPEEVLMLERHNIGLNLIHQIVRQNLHGQVTLHNDHGAVTTIRFKPVD